MQIEMEYLSVVNVAMQQNRVPVIRELRAANPADHPCNEVIVTTTVEPPFATAESTALGTLAVSETRRTSDVRLQLDPALKQENGRAIIAPPRT